MGVKVSWTALVYILSADFADALPADEDQMPPDGNPHPLPGQMMQNNHIWVLPQFPQLGWNEIPPEQDNQQQQEGDFQFQFHNAHVVPELEV